MRLLADLEACLVAWGGGDGSTRFHQTEAGPNNPTKQRSVNRCSIRAFDEKRLVLFETGAGGDYTTHQELYSRGVESAAE